MAYYKRSEVFFMSLEEERKILFPLYYMYYEIERAHASDRLNEDRLDEIRAKKREEMLEAFRASKIDLSKVRELGDRLVSQRWYCAYYIPPEHEEWQKVIFSEDSAPYALLTSDNTAKSIKLTPKEYPDFYAMLDPDTPQLKSNIQFWARARSTLKLPKDYLFINLGALEVILAVLELTSGEEEALIPQIPAIFSTKVSSIEFPLDKLNSNIWRADPNQIEGQMSLLVEMGKSGEGAMVYYSIDFEALEKDLQITKRLEPYDRRVYNAVNAIYNSREEKVDRMSITQIYNAMGNKGRPAAVDIEKINISITKMSKAHVTIDNKEEAEKHKRQQYWSYDSALLPCERVQGYVNGQFAESILHIFREPPIISFAKAHGQLTTIPPTLLQSPISKTRSNILLEDYLIERIAKIRTGNSPAKILLATVYEKTEITTVKQKQRAPEKIKTILDHFKKQGWIKGYKMDKISIVVKV